MFNIRQFILANRICCEKSKALYERISPTLKSLGLIVGSHDGEQWAFQVYNSECSIGISISIPPDIQGEGVESVYETARIDSSGKLLYDSDLGNGDVRRCNNVNDLIQELHRTLIVTDEDDFITECSD